MAKMTRITFDVGEDLHLWLKIHCARKKTHISDLMRALVLEHKAKVEKPEKAKKTSDK